MPETLEQESRRLRNTLMGGEISDKSWEHIKEHWMDIKELTWLREWVREATKKDLIKVIPESKELKVKDDVPDKNNDMIRIIT